VRRTVPPSAEIEAQIDRLLAVGVGENPRESLSELARLGARLIIQRAVEDEFDAWLGRARYERRPDYQRGLRNYESGLRNGFRPRRLQTAEGELLAKLPERECERVRSAYWQVTRRSSRSVATESVAIISASRLTTAANRPPGNGSARSKSASISFTRAPIGCVKIRARPCVRRSTLVSMPTTSAAPESASASVSRALSQPASSTEPAPATAATISGTPNGAMSRR
jgi:hypothetical protein